MSHHQKYPDFKDRQAVLAVRRAAKMARSSDNYVRGNTKKFYEWLTSSASAQIPQGPSIWICGDCHVGNLGPVCNAKGETTIQIRDLDQTVIGNPAHDLIRLGLSLANAARGSDLPGLTVVKMLENVVKGYNQAFMHPGKKAKRLAERPDAIEGAMKDAVKRNWKDLARERIEDTKPAIPLGKRFWPLVKAERDELKEVFANERVRRLVTSLRSRDDDAPVELVDAAFWVKGCSSLGRLRYAVLLSVGDKDRELCLMDVKEAVQAAAPAYSKTVMPRDHADRVVKGAWHVSPPLGNRMLSLRLQGRPVFIRELLPQDLKLDIRHFAHDEALKIGRFLAMVVGQAHARQMDGATLRQWQKEVSHCKTKAIGVPSWLWTSVVELMVNHEGAYLEHCKKCATDTEEVNS